MRMLAAFLALVLVAFAALSGCATIDLRRMRTDGPPSGPAPAAQA